MTTSRVDAPMAAGDAGSRAAEWRAAWPLVLAAAIGVSLQPAAMQSVGQFVMPLQDEFGWTRAQILSGVSLSAFIIFLTSGPIGRMVDRFDARRIAILGVILCGLSVAALSLTSGDVRLWLLLWGLYAITAGLIAPTVWIAAVSGAFPRGLNLAMSVVLCGAGLATVVGPIASRWLIDAFGWRPAFQLLGLSWGGVSLALTLAFFFDRRPGRAAAGPAHAAAPSGSKLLKLLGSPAFLTLAAAIFGVTAAMSSLLINLSPLLVDGGTSRAQAANIASLAGLGMILGKLSVGWLFEHVRPLVVTTGTMVALGLACLLFQHVGWGDAPAMAAALALGLSIGGMMAITACMTARLFAQEDFGTVYGSLVSAMALGGIVGPVAAGYTYDVFKSYDVLLWAGVGAAAGAAVLLGVLDRFRRG
jgi:predicted MFS family arabinose efflux permease